jgi:hypothetical protein
MPPDNCQAISSQTFEPDQFQAPSPAAIFSRDGRFMSIGSITLKGCCAMAATARSGTHADIAVRLGHLLALDQDFAGRRRAT